MTPDAFAASGISNATANDPDDADAVYSVGDTITIAFPAQVNSSFAGLTMSNTEFRANFTVNPSDIDTADTLTGVWNAGATAVTLTINTIAGSTPPIINTDTFEYDPTLGNIHYQINGTEFTSAAVTLTGDFGLFVAASTTNNGGGCSGDCEEPTLGVDNLGARLVDNGFTYNGQSIDVERYFTPYPLVTVQTGEQNVAEFKIYENTGSDNISHFELAFGLAKGQSIGMSKAVINWDKSWDGIETVTLVDPENVLENIIVTTSEGNCSDEFQQKCLIVKVAHTFRAPLDFNMLGTNVWDVKRNAWQNFYNHGIEIVGESLNPPKEYDGIYKGHIYHLTETSKTTAVDELGDTWTFDKIWTRDFKNTIITDPEWNVMTRHNSNFNNHVDAEAVKAIDTLMVSCPTCLKSFDDFTPSKTITYSERINKLDNPEIQSKMFSESERAQKTMVNLLDPLLSRIQ
ncbi:MAG: hypothetical protein KGZ37_10550 [Nitrosarchaeum sp.]|nr:hypothetical protein [Nitrosarchaeum sp.]